MRHDSGLRRKVFLGTTVAAVSVITLVTVILTVLALTSSAQTADRLAAAGDVIVGATLLLAAIAAIVALVAYAVSTGAPDIRLSVQLGPFANQPQFEAVHPNDMLGLFDVPQPTKVRIFLRNESGYSAKNPAILIRLRRIIFEPDLNVLARDPGWVYVGIAEEVIGEVEYFLHQLQWDGGPTYSIHGHSTRVLPPLNLYHLSHIPDDFLGPPALTFEILAEGYRKITSLSVDFLVDEVSRYPQEKHNPQWM